MEKSDFQNLVKQILKLSNSQIWGEAKLEWQLVNLSLQEHSDHCICGHEIKEQCHIENIKNGNKTIVGNVCIFQFLNLKTAGAFKGLKRIQQDITANCNEALINYARKFLATFLKMNIIS